MGIFDPPQEQRPGAGLKGRLIVAFLIALFAIFMYMTHVEENPVTGEKQHIAITPAEEVRMGLESAPLMSRKMGGELPAGDPRVLEVQRIGNESVTHGDAKKSPWKFQFHVLEDPKTVNAFALPGGQIFITLGLLNKMQNEAQLSGVLSHEIGHVIERHSAEQMAKSQLGQLLVVAVGAATSDPNRAGQYSPAFIAAMVNQMIQLRYSRKDESEADTWGLKLMQKAGYDPRQMIKVMEILKASGGKGGGPEFFQTHPNPDLRIKQIEEYLKAHPVPADLGLGRPLQGGIAM